MPPSDFPKAVWIGFIQQLTYVSEYDLPRLEAMTCDQLALIEELLHRQGIKLSCGLDPSQGREAPSSFAATSRPQRSEEAAVATPPDSDARSTQGKSEPRRLVGASTKVTPEALTREWVESLLTSAHPNGDAPDPNHAPDRLLVREIRTWLRWDSDGRDRNEYNARRAARVICNALNDRDGSPRT